MNLFLIPLTPDTSDQRISTELDGNPYIIRVLWNERFGYFSLSLYTIAGDPILENIKMVTNYDLTSRFKDERMPAGPLYFVRRKGPYKRPEYSDLGVTHFLYYRSPDRVVTAQPVYGKPAVTPTQFEDNYPYPTPEPSYAV